MRAQPDVEELRALGLLAGLDAVGIAPADPFTSTRQDLEDRKAAGLHAGMGFTYRNPARSTDPGAAVVGARAIVVGARAYVLEEPAADRPGPHGRIARYAWVDHYTPLKAALRVVALRLRADGWRAVVFADDNGLVDREAAYRAGLGWYGKNANLLLPGLGSWFVLGSVVTDAPLPVTTRPQQDGCGACRRCLDGCPTGAIVAPGVVDARRCLAWLVQRPGRFPVEHRVALGDRIYGCDDCQEVCPPNARAQHRGVLPRHDAETEAASDAGAGPATASAGAIESSVPLLELLAASDAELLARHGRWYIADRDARWLRRNALIALGNVGDGADPAVDAALRQALLGDDAMIRAHAVWAAARLGRHDLLELVRRDRSPEVRAELAALGQVPLRTDRAAVHLPRAGTTTATTAPTAPPVHPRAPTTHALAAPAYPVATPIDPAPVDPAPVDPAPVDPAPAGVADRS